MPFFRERGDSDEAYFYFLARRIDYDCAVFTIAGTVMAAPGIVAPGNLVIQNGFEGDFTNTAHGGASVGATGDGTPSGPISFVASQPGGGQAANFGTGFDDITYNDAAFTNLIGATGMTYGMFVEGSGVFPVPTPVPAPAHFFNFRTPDLGGK